MSASEPGKGGVGCIAIVVVEAIFNCVDLIRGEIGPVCVPRTSSALISRKNHLTSAHHDRAAVFRYGCVGCAIQVEEPTWSPVPVVNLIRLAIG
jgi:hypothetical protein